MKVPSNRIKDIRIYYTKQLSTVSNSQESAFMVDTIIAHYLNIRRMELALNYDRRVGESMLLKIHFAVKDLMKHRPLQYVLGETEFCNSRFFVDEDVLIPRPETEELVEMIISENKNNSVPMRILDIGTGSGCIAVSLANTIDSDVYAVDISSAALNIARKNSALNNVSVEFIELDILNVVDCQEVPDEIDIIVSNPPYVRDLEKSQMQSNVLEFEPSLALFVKDNKSLIFYEAISKIAVKKLKTNGVLWFEINEYLAKETSHLVAAYFEKVEVFNDYKGRPRFLKAFSIT